LAAPSAWHEPPRPSRWASIKQHFLQSVLGFERSPHDCIVLSKDTGDRQLPAHTVARYGGDLVLRFNISTSEESASLAEAADTLMLDVWEFAHDWVDVRLSKDSVPLLLGLLPDSLQHAHKPLLGEKELSDAIIANYQKSSHRSASTFTQPMRRPQSANLEQASAADTNIFFADFQPFNVIEPWLRLMSSLFTTHVRHINIGLSYEGRNIPAMRVGVHPTNDDDPDPPRRKTILIVGSLHAREWISTTTVNYIAYSLITGYGKDHMTTQLLENFDFVFIPTMNPDGYIYTWETDRLWRKNRQQTGIRFCQGMDLDRSFGFEWSATDNPCSESYTGEAPFEAVEAKRLADWAKNETENNVEFVGFLDLHSYSQEIRYPYSFSCDEEPPGLENLEELAMGLSKAIRATNGRNYEVMSACEGNAVFTSNNKKLRLRPSVEPTGGSALDFFYRTIGVRYAYQLKLRDRGTYGFLLPKEHIIPAGKEILNAVLYFSSFLNDLYDVSSGSAKKAPKLTPLAPENEEVARGEVVNKIDQVEGEEDGDPWVVIEDMEIKELKLDLKRRRRR
ncbi:hypothetical protein CERZMDRAFT_27286, partial [Cercospora zeae-maydis SCOH1-5]